MSLAMELFAEDSRMSMGSGGELSNLSPCKPMTTTVVNKQHQQLIKQEAADSASEKQPSVRKSWFEQVEEEENQQKTKKSGAAMEQKVAEIAPPGADALASSDSKMSLDESAASSGSGNSSGRQIEIDILDSANVEKYEKLIRSDKIKSPFKRRLSGEGDEDDDGNGNDGHAEFCDQQQKPKQQQPPEDGHDTDEYDDRWESSATAKTTAAQPANRHKKTKTHEDDHGRERFRRESTDSGDGSSSQSSRKPIEYEKDVETLVRRQKQIDYGKNTLGYEYYTKQVPRDQRTKDHPRTPPKHIKYSRRAWDGLVRVWRKQLHCFDPEAKMQQDDRASPDN